MYRTLGTRGVVFGVPSGPYAGKERRVEFSRMNAGAKQRLVSALTGKIALAPILSTSIAQRSFTAIGLVFAVFVLFAFFFIGWPDASPWWSLLIYVDSPLLILWLAQRRARSVTFDGVTIPTGTHLFPLDIIETNRDGTLRVIPLGAVREAAVAQVASRPTLLLTFKDGASRAFPVSSPREAETAYAALEDAQRTLEKLTFANNLSDAVNLDPFFELRTDDSWKSVEPKDRSRAQKIGMYVLAGALGIGLFFGRNALAAHSRKESLAAARAKMDAALAVIQEADRAREESHRKALAQNAYRADTALDPNARATREAARARALAAYDKLAPNPEILALVHDAAKHAAESGQGLKMYFSVTTDIACKQAEMALCDDPKQTSYASFEDRFAAAFQTVFSETLPRDLLPIDRATGSLTTPSVLVHTTMTRQAAGPQAIAMAFDVTVYDLPGKTVRTFRLTMPPPKDALTTPRDHSVFFLGDHPDATDLVYARGFDRLYDEVFGLFFTGNPRVPSSNRKAEDDLRKTFGAPSNP